MTRSLVRRVALHQKNLLLCRTERNRCEIDLSRPNLRNACELAEVGEEKRQFKDVVERQPRRARHV